MPRMTIEKQILLNGKKITAVSSQSDKLLKLFRNSKTVRKPIPGEANFNPLTKKLLKKLDAGIISRNEIIQLDMLIRQQGAKGLLERFLFADPSGKIRPSRLGLTNKKGRLLDYLSDDITFRKPKPQILLFDETVAKYPKNLLKIVKKIKIKKVLTSSEASKFLEWYIKKSSKLKPLGFVSREAEVVLAPGEIIKKVKTVAVFTYEGRRIPVVFVKILKPSPKLKSLLVKFYKNTITSSERILLKRLLKKETGFNYGVSSSLNVQAKYVSIKRVGVSLGRYFKTSSLSYKAILRKSISKIGSKTSSKKLSKFSRISKSSSKKSSIKRSPSSKGVSRKSPRRRSPPSSPPKRSSLRRSPPIKPPVLISKLKKQFTNKKLSKAIPGFYIVTKKRGKMVKLFPKPLTQKDGRDFLSYSIDNNLTRSAWMIPMGKSKQVVRPPKQIQGYFNKNSKKLRPYKIRYGKKKQMVNGYIEKRKYFQDTVIEKAQLRNARKRGIRRYTKRKLTPTQKKVMLKNLKRARAMRIRTTIRRPVKRRPVRRPISVARRKQLKRVRTMRDSSKSRPTTTIKRKISPQQRKILIQRLKKARAIRMRNLKRK